MTISGAVPASFQHDPFGRRVSKTIGGMTQYLYDGANPVQEISGTTASANLLTGSVDEYFQRTDSAGARNFLTDALGTGQSRLSFHLKALKDAGIVTHRRQGRWIYYALNPGVGDAVERFAEALRSGRERI